MGHRSSRNRSEGVLAAREPTGAGVFLGGVLPIVVAAALVSVRGAVDNVNVASVLVVVVVVAAWTGGRVAGAVAAVTAALSFDFFPRRPTCRSPWTSSDDVETTVLLLIGGCRGRHHRGPWTMVGRR